MVSIPRKKSQKRALDRFVAYKRIMDTTIIVVLSPVWVPVLLTAVMLTLLDSGRPCFYSQTRMGRRGNPFSMLKIRTMDPYRKPPEGILFDGWTYPNDPRITRMGRPLRRYRIDELPQLVNVLRGDMSITGPRPEPLEVARALGEQIPRYHDRHLVRPGITGICQISKDYLEFGTVEQSARKLAHDVEYVDHPSLLREITILWRTLRVILRGAGVA